MILKLELPWPAENDTTQPHLERWEILNLLKTYHGQWKRWPQNKCSWALVLSKTDKRTNQSVLEELCVKPELLLTINRRNFRCLDHTNKSTKIIPDDNSTVLQGKVEAQMNTGRQSILYMSNITENSGLSLSKVIHSSQDLQQWQWNCLDLGKQPLISVTTIGEMCFWKFIQLLFTFLILEIWCYGCVLGLFH